MALAGFFALHESPLPEADFVIALGDSLKTLDPAGITWVDEGLVAMGLWEGLSSYDPETLEVMEGTAKYPPKISEDGLTYTFELRQEARWSNGDPVRAGDFVYGWRRAIEPGTAGEYIYLYLDHIAGAKAYNRWRNEAVKVLITLRDLQQGKEVSDDDRRLIDSLGLPGAAEKNYVEMARHYRREHQARMDEEFSKVGVQALDDHTLRVRLTRRIGYFLELMPFTTFYPVHAESIEKLRDKDNELGLLLYDPQWVKPDYHRNDYPGLVTNGPFRLADWQFKRYMYLERNEYYWDVETVKSARFLILIMAEPSTAFLTYEKGQIDFLRQLTRLDFVAALVEQAEKKERNDIHLKAAYGTYFYIFNCNEKLPDGRENPFEDWRVRMAFNLAVDKQSIVENVKKTGNPVSRNLVPPGTIAGYFSEPGPEYNVTRARELLAQAGFPKGQGLPTIELTYNNGFGHEKVAQVVAEMWRHAFDVNVKLMGKELKSFDEDRRNQQFMIQRASWYGDYGDPTTFLDLLVTDNGNNHGKFSNAKFDQLMRSASLSSDAKKRMAVLSEAEHLLMHEQMPILPIYYYVNIMGFRENVRGVYPNARDKFPFKYMHIAK